jgi:hypothetical protein
VAKIRPAIEDLMEKYQLSAHLDPHNAGVLIVDLTGQGGRDVSWAHLSLRKTDANTERLCPRHRKAAAGQRRSVHHHVAVNSAHWLSLFAKRLIFYIAKCPNVPSKCLSRS